jgi:hypothetical protein
MSRSVPASRPKLTDPQSFACSEHLHAVKKVGKASVCTSISLLASSILAQHFSTGGLETAEPGCYDAVAIARTGFPYAGYEPHP